MPLRPSYLRSDGKAKASRRVPLRPVQETLRPLLRFNARAQVVGRDHGSGELDLVPVVGEGTTGVLLYVRIFLVLRSAGARLDRHRDGRIRHAHFHPPGDAHLRGREG